MLRVAGVLEHAARAAKLSAIRILLPRSKRLRKLNYKYLRISIFYWYYFIIKFFDQIHVGPEVAAYLIEWNIFKKN